MKLISTSGGRETFTFREAVLRGVAPDGGLLIPADFPALSADFVSGASRLTFQDIAFEMARLLIDGEIPDSDLERIIRASLSFPVPLVKLRPGVGILELFHGPTLAFKDFGARFMARTLEYFQGGGERTILVATSGDTGSAVANAFAGMDGMTVILLYPSGRVSRAQELQLTTAGVTALEVEGTFDDCQRLVKQAFADPTICARRNLTSANSINVARLLPQTFYYAEAYARMPEPGIPIVFSVPCGNLGNLTGGLIARRMGIPVKYFLAATNVNCVFTDFLASGKFSPATVTTTLSNAMDVGNPSNLARISSVFGQDVKAMRGAIRSVSVTDAETLATIRTVHERTGYLLDPHGAVAFAALDRTEPDERRYGVVLETAHPAKFPEAYDERLRASMTIPARLQEALRKAKRSVPMSGRFAEFKDFLMR